MREDDHNNPKKRGSQSVLDCNYSGTQLIDIKCDFFNIL